MLICSNCKKHIKYIVIKNNTVLIVDPEIKTLVTEKGRIVEGYSIHECEEKEE